MNYKLTITKNEANPHYKEPERMYGYGQCEPVMEREIEVYQTMATLNEEQWQKVQKAIIEALD